MPTTVCKVAIKEALHSVITKIENDNSWYAFFRECYRVSPESVCQFSKQNVELLKIYSFFCKKRKEIRTLKKMRPAMLKWTFGVKKKSVVYGADIPYLFTIKLRMLACEQERYV